MQVQDILVDTLTFTLGTGQEESRRDGLETIEGIRELKRRYPEVQTTLGLSNISFGLKPAARQVLNSVFLHECVKAGLDSAIVHAAKIVPVARIPQEQQRRRARPHLRPAPVRRRTGRERGHLRPAVACSSSCSRGSTPAR